jgi:hypothetical protein
MAVLRCALFCCCSELRADMQAKDGERYRNTIFGINK